MNLVHGGPIVRDRFRHFDLHAPRETGPGPTRAAARAELLDFDLHASRKTGPRRR